ncbi:cytidylyltransferase domain-containing protein [Brevundimonas diminuta]|uniref:acylneuraminate cytidylyltransferase family protein n=1 Tax=Brevundimonas diminuta TaxID=293 RepID=UPI001F56D8CC|nr:hypothetical protein [Brevundimonas diminuta]
MNNSIDCYIPARLGSLRVPAKNLRLLGGMPLIAHAINTLKRTETISSFCVNTESPIISEVARKYGAAVYDRRPDLAISSTSTDEIIYDYALNSSSDHLLLVNPTAPFLKSESIDSAARQYLKTGQNLFSSTLTRRHAYYNGEPLNFLPASKSPRTQELTSVEFINFIFIFLNRAKMVSAYENSGSCLYSGDMQLWPLDGLEAWDIDDEFDFQIAQLAIDRQVAPKPEYVPEVASLIRSGLRFEN